MKRKVDDINLPVYEIFINEDDFTGIRFISIVEEPAIEVKGIFLKNIDSSIKDQEFKPANIHENCRCTISNGNWNLAYDACDICIKAKSDYEKEFKKEEFKFKSVSDKRLIVGPALIPNIKIKRIDEKTGDYYFVYFSKETIKFMVSKFNRENNNTSINDDHSNRIVNGYLFENWIVEDPIYDKSRLYGYNLPVGSWFITVKIEDEDYWNNEVKTGKHSFSVEGLMAQVLKNVNFSEIKKSNDLDTIIDSLNDYEIERIIKEIFG